MAASIYVGMSGWTNEGWRGSFYPESVGRTKELEFASRKVNSIEINGTFYSLQKPAVFQKWHDETPENFVFSVKAPRYITHIRRLKDCAEPLANFLASGLFCLGEKMGPILWQFPPFVTLKDERFAKFLEMLPFDSRRASALAKQHSSKVAGRSYTSVHGDYPIRHAFEFRHPSFKNPEFFALLRRYGVAVVFAHSGLKSPYFEDTTADFIYARMHGQEEQYADGYPDDVLEWWAKRVTQWTHGEQPPDAQCVSPEPASAVARDAFIYFDTEAKEHAPFEAMKLAKRLGIDTRELAPVLLITAPMRSRAGKRS